MGVIPAAARLFNGGGLWVFGKVSVVIPGGVWGPNTRRLTPGTGCVPLVSCYCRSSDRHCFFDRGGLEYDTAGHIDSVKACAMIGLCLPVPRVPTGG